MILAIDTATDQASVALLADDVTVAEFSWRSRGNHSRHLGSLLPELFSLAGIAVERLTGIAVSSGPGSFNGLRVGISLAKGLAFARNLPLAGISTLDVIGFSAARDSRPVLALLSAGRGELFSASYEGIGASWRRMSEYRRLSVSGTAETFMPQSVLAGEGAAVLAQELSARGISAEMQDAGSSLRRAGYLAELGRHYFDAHLPDGLDDLQPLYLRRSAAEEKLATSQGE